MGNFGLTKPEVEFLQKVGISTFGQLREAVAASHNETLTSIFIKVLQATVPAI